MALRVADVEKFFGATHALRGVSLDLNRHEVHGLVGENGCGKSTLVKVLSGVHQADTGWIEGGDGERISAEDVSPAAARDMGVTVVHQEAPIFPSMSIEDNLSLGRRYPTRMGRVDRGAIRRQAQEVIDHYEIPADPKTPAHELNPAVRAMVAIARALRDSAHRDRGILILDEPTAGLNEFEADDLLQAVARYAGEGQAVMLVSHRLDEIVGACKRVTVMRDGAVVQTVDGGGIDRGNIVRLMVGSDLAKEYEADTARSAEASSNPVALRVEGLSSELLHHVSLEAHQGEILGLAGQLGAGCSELLRIAYGIAPFSAGKITVADRELKPGRFGGRALADLIGYVPADRPGEGMFAGRSVRENLGIAENRRYWRGGVFRRAQENRDSEALIEQFRIKTANAGEPMTSLSGGNQQKVVMARVMRRERPLLLLDEPSQGVDVGARADIHRSIRETADVGAAVVIVSSDMEELVRLCDRVVVFVDGRVAGQIEKRDLDREMLSNSIHQDLTAVAGQPNNPSGGHR
ncbi:MAG: sugar ABC transporter ATP-binding protein [Pirellulales bacterium]